MYILIILIIFLKDIKSFLMIFIKLVFCIFIRVYIEGAFNFIKLCLPNFYLENNCH